MPQKGGGSGLEDGARPRALSDIRLIGEIRLGSPDGKPKDLYALRFKSGDLTPDEAMGRARVLIDKIGDPQAL